MLLAQQNHSHSVNFEFIKRAANAMLAKVKNIGNAYIQNLGYLLYNNIDRYSSDSLDLPKRFYSIR